MLAFTQQLKIYYIINVYLVSDTQWIRPISNVPYHEIIISDPILLTYKQLFYFIRNDIRRNIIEDFQKYLTTEVKLTHFRYHKAHSIGLIYEDIKQLKFDIDVTKPFYLYKLIENVI